MFSYGLTGTERTDTEPLGYGVLSLYFEDLALITHRRWHLSTANTIYLTLKYTPLHQPWAKASWEYVMDKKTCKMTSQTALLIIKANIGGKTVFELEIMIYN